WTASPAAMPSHTSPVGCSTPSPSRPDPRATHLSTRSTTMARPLITTAVVAGAVAWLAKVGVIVATDGRVTDDGVAGLLFGIGGALLLAGAVGLGVELTRERPAMVRTAAG